MSPEKIHYAIAEYDREHYESPFDKWARDLASKRKAEEEAERPKREAREARQLQAGNTWWAAVLPKIDARIQAYIKEYFFSEDEDHPAHLTDLLAKLVSAERADRRAEVKAVVEAERRYFETRLAEVEQRCKAVPGKLPPVKTWREGGVIYEGEVASHDGALWQARCDTGQRPGGDA